MDGVPDVITAPGPRRSADIKVFDGRTGDLITEFQAYHPEYRGGVDIAAGFVIDGAGETPPQIVTSSTRGLPRIRVFGWNAANHQYEQKIEFIAFGSAGYDGGAKISVGDVKGRDGVQEVVVSSGAGRAPYVYIFQLSNSFAFNNYSFLSAPLSYRGGMDVAVHNVTGAIEMDVVVGHGLTVSPDDPQNGRIRAYNSSLIPK